MSPQLVAVILSLASFVVGGVLVWRLLDRGQLGSCRTLAEELTERVHDHVAAYQQLEERINLILSDFDQQDDPQVLTGSSEETFVTAMEPDVLGWMDGCGEAQSAVPGTAVHAHDIDRSIVVEHGVQETETVVDSFAHHLQIMQKERSAELEIQRRAIESLERRVQDLEATMHGSPGTRAETGRDLDMRSEPDLVALCDRIARSEQEIVAWHAAYEKLARERLANVEHARELAARHVAAPSPRRADPAADGAPTQIGTLMKSLESTKSEVESYRSKLQEQNSQFTAAYAMLDRMRPLVQALESEFATHPRGVERRRG